MNKGKTVKIITLPRPSELPDVPTHPDILTYAIQILNTNDSVEKSRLTFEAYDFYKAGKIPICVGNIADCPDVPDTPARPTNLTVVKPTEIISKIKNDAKANALRLIHSQAHIESYAIDLSWDILARFCRPDQEIEGSTDRTYRTYLPIGEVLPRLFFEDWLQVAEDEARHFMSWHDRLLELGSYYGAFPTHNSLWESADSTKKSLLARLAVVHMVHEAHGLDCGDRLVNQLKGAGDPVSAALLRTIQDEEIDHVKAGTTWFKYVCQQSNIDDIPKFHEIVRVHFRGALRPPFAVKERALAGMTEEWYMPLAKRVEPKLDESLDDSLTTQKQKKILPHMKKKLQELKQLQELGKQIEQTI